MKNKLFMLRPIVFFLACALIFSCANMAENKVPEIADDYCKCFAAEDKGLSKNTKAFIKVLAYGERDEQVIAEEREKLSEEELAEFTEFFGILQNKKSKVGKCIAKVDKKIKEYRTKDKDEFYDKLVDEMEGRKNCKAAAYVFMIGRDEMKKNAEDSETEEEVE